MSGLEFMAVVDRRGTPIDLADIVPLMDALIARWRPLQIWLFGSRARGDASAESDWDLLAVVPDETPDAEFDPLIAWDIRKQARVPVDVIPVHAHDFHEYRDVCQSLAYEAAHHGVLIHERA